MLLTDHILPTVAVALRDVTVLFCTSNHVATSAALDIPCIQMLF